MTTFGKEGCAGHGDISSTGEAGAGGLKTSKRAGGGEGEGEGRRGRGDRSMSLSEEGPYNGRRWSGHTGKPQVRQKAEGAGPYGW